MRIVHIRNGTTPKLDRTNSNSKNVWKQRFPVHNSHGSRGGSENVADPAMTPALSYERAGLQVSYGALIGDDQALVDFQTYVVPKSNLTAGNKSVTFHVLGGMLSGFAKLNKVLYHSVRNP
ncbi:hypothetical protein H257_11313 [Aphanomyces astaci]|uniref:Uncharacterized protein n=1 Tax=Aphanomyces astaci TaxID=112090 RepID=W4G2U0_APHAT|nr:hypothetical protein H257_11313 [Aphanomyces astaci]ETV74005.1 hypothetical protein H257_11313 [Aphanomyces astaci]|eukprot:XP_009836518.1 hypothetical protein H257_11313 [Aphanomyces astaci]